MTGNRSVVLALALALVALPGKTARPAFQVAQVYQKSFSHVTSVLSEVGKRRSLGQGNSHVEYSLPAVGVFVLFDRQAKAVLVTTTFRRPRASVDQALAEVGLRTGGRKPDRATPILRLWNNLSGVRHVLVRSSDGRTWSSVEVGDLKR